MCTLHLFYQVFPEAPILFAANRDENLDRAWRDPGLLLSLPQVYGPRDLTAGGTWLGVNELGLLVSLANHDGTLSSSPSLCSRGTIVLETLRHQSAEEARRFAEWAGPACKAYTLLIVDPNRGFVVDHSADGTQTYRLLPGCHVITNARFRAPGDQKARRSLEWMKRLAGHRLPSSKELFRFLSDHQPESSSVTPLCIHPEGGGRFGTSSASVIRIAPNGNVDEFCFASGPPCSNPGVDVTPDWRHQRLNHKG